MCDHILNHGTHIPCPPLFVRIGLHIHGVSPGKKAFADSGRKTTRRRHAFSMTMARHARLRSGLPRRSYSSVGGRASTSLIATDSSPERRFKPENDPSSLWRASPRHAIRGSWRTSLRSDELRLGRRFRPQNDKSRVTK